jgi:hypothetical protein
VPVKQVNYGKTTQDHRNSTKRSRENETNQFRAFGFRKDPHLLAFFHQNRRPAGEGRADRIEGRRNGEKRWRWRKEANKA